MAVYFSVVKLG